MFVFWYASVKKHSIHQALLKQNTFRKLSYVQKKKFLKPEEAFDFSEVWSSGLK